MPVRRFWAARRKDIFSLTLIPSLCFTSVFLLYGDLCAACGDRWIDPLYRARPPGPVMAPGSLLLPTLPTSVGRTHEVFVLQSAALYLDGMPRVTRFCLAYDLNHRGLYI